MFVRVNNTQLSQVTFWDLDKFDSRLEQMRELYVVSEDHTITSCQRHHDSLPSVPLSYSFFSLPLLFSFHSLESSLCLEPLPHSFIISSSYTLLTYCEWY